jgi:hypothetical protein
MSDKVRELAEKLRKELFSELNDRSGFDTRGFDDDIQQEWHEKWDQIITQAIQQALDAQVAEGVALRDRVLAIVQKHGDKVAPKEQSDFVVGFKDYLSMNERERRNFNVNHGYLRACLDIREEVQALTQPNPRAAQIMEVVEAARALCKKAFVMEKPAFAAHFRDSGEEEKGLYKAVEALGVEGV